MLLRRRFHSTGGNGKIDTSKDYFNIQSIHDNNNISFTNTIYYSINNGNWDTLLAGESVTINNGDKIYFKAELSPTSYGIGTFTISNWCNLSGNIMSLLYGDDFEEQTDLTGKTYTFRYLFENCEAIVNAKELVLPATTLENYCYANMFNNCTYLISAPELPSTTLVSCCYYCMFYGCKSLEITPELPATILADDCYYNMFANCISLTAASELPAIELTSYCYARMFSGCENLTKAPQLPAITLASYCYQYMFSDCTSLTKAPKLPAITLTSYCYYHMFENCTSLTTAPELPSRDLANYCYSYMFRNCTNLASIPELPAITLKPYCYNYMFAGCKNIKQSGELPARILVNYCYQHMFNGCSSLQHIISMASNISAANCLNSWTTAVSSYGDFLKNPDVDISMWSNGVSGIPNGWRTGSYYGKEDNTDYRKEYFTLEAVTKGEMTLYKPYGYNSNYLLQYSFNDSEWIDFNSDTIINVVKGDKIKIKALSGNYYYSANNRVFDSTGYYKVYGNILSLLCGNEFEDIKYCIDYDIEYYNIWFCDLNNIASISTFQGLFANSKTLVSAKNLILPFTNLYPKCYQRMFGNCTNLVEAPELPATTLEGMCYQAMFNGCTSLTAAPELPATELARQCYYGMFQSCTSLTKAPELHADTLVSSCYSYMFNGCTNLKEIILLATTIPSTNYLTNWVSGVANSGTFSKSPSLSTVINEGNSGVPTGWTVENFTN